MQGLKRIAQKIHAAEADGNAEKLTTRQRNKERVKTVLKKLVHLMNSLQVKSGSELVFPMLFDHMSFATHRCWETNLKVAYAKTLSAWQEHFKGSLKALHEKASVSQSIGFFLPAQQSGRANELPAGWLMQRRPQNASQSANAAATVAVVEEETGEDQQFIYISPGGQRFTSLQQALQYAQNDKLRNRLNAEMQALQTESFDHNSNIHVQFTSNHEDYMHRGGHPIMQALPAYVYNMWVYGARKQSSQDPLGDYVISFDYDVDYKPSALVRTQRLSLIPKIPPLEGMQIPSPDVDPHKMSLIKLLLFKPLGQSNDMDEKGNPLDPYRAIFLDAENAQKKLKRGEQENPYDVFPRAWKQYWQDTVLPKAADAQKKIEARMELPTLWECLEVFSCRKTCAKRSTWFHQMRIASASLVAMHVPSCRIAWRCRSMCAIWRKNWSRTSTLMVVPRQRRKPSHMLWTQMQKKIQGYSAKLLGRQALAKNPLNQPLKMLWILISMARCD